MAHLRDDKGEGGRRPALLCLDAVLCSAGLAAYKKHAAHLRGDTGEGGRGPALLCTSAFLLQGRACFAGERQGRLPPVAPCCQSPTLLLLNRSCLLLPLSLPAGHDHLVLADMGCR